MKFKRFFPFQLHITQIIFWLKFLLQSWKSQQWIYRCLTCVPMQNIYTEIVIHTIFDALKDRYTYWARSFAFKVIFFRSIVVCKTNSRNILISWQWMESASEIQRERGEGEIKLNRCRIRRENPKFEWMRVYLFDCNQKMNEKIRFIYNVYICFCVRPIFVCKIFFRIACYKLRKNKLICYIIFFIRLKNAFTK